MTILEALPRILPNMDKEISQNLKLILKKRGIDIHTAAAVQGVEAEGDQYVCKYIEKEKEQSATSQYVLCAVGRCPNTDGLFSEDATPEMNRGRVVVNEKFETSIPGVYAIGDLIFGAQLAHTASAQGIQVAEQLAGIEVDFSGESNTLIVRNQDRPGCITEVSAALSKEKINVATMQVFRHKRGGSAVMVVETDQPIPQNVVSELKKKEDILEVISLNLEERGA